MGSGNGELKAAMQYMPQAINLLNGHDADYTEVDAWGNSIHVILGLNPGLINANHEETHNAMFRKAFNRMQDSSSNKDFGVTKEF